MSIALPFVQLRKIADRFNADARGNIAVIFAIALLPLIGFVGAAIDYSRTNKARSAMQAALDSAALMVSKDFSSGTIASSEIDAKAQKYFNAMYNNSDASSIRVAATYTNTGQGSSIKVTGSGSVKTEFMKIVGFPQMDIGSASTTNWGSTRMRVALVLDVTGSMAQDNKLPNLKSAATAMITTLSKLNKVDGDVFISVVPFAKDVNVGSYNTPPTWTTGWANWADEPAAIKTTKPDNWNNYGPGSKCPFGNQNFGCTSAPTNGSAGVSKIPNSGTYSGYICPSIDSSTSVYYNGCYDSTASGGSSTVDVCKGSKDNNCSCSNYAINGDDSGSCSCTGSGHSKVCSQTLLNYTHNWIANDKSTWNGCVTDREQDYDTKNTEPKLGDSATQFVVEQWSSCPPKLTPMSNKWDDLITNINNMAASGNTNQPIGLAWGWLSLTEALPLNSPSKDANYVYDDYIVLVSDGLNTQDRWYRNAADIDAREKILCETLKAAPYNKKVFTIQINTGSKPDPTSTVLKECASSADNFQIITSADQTAAAFQNVTNKIANLRVAY